jgi:hypothetical protein
MLCCASFPKIRAPCIWLFLQSRPKSFKNPLFAPFRESPKAAQQDGCLQIEAFARRSILFKFKEGENFNRRHTWSIPRIKI